MTSAVGVPIEHPRPNSPAEAVKIALASVGHFTYWLGTGDCDTANWGRSDCAGFAICRCYNIRRHRPGFNKGPWATVESDINCNSAIEDADHHRELFERVTSGPPQPGDLLCYPTFVSQGHKFIGHVAIVVGTDRLLEWDWTRPTWSYLDVVQCCGPNGRTPGVIATTASHWDDHDRVWPKPEHRSVLIRVVG